MFLKIILFIRRECAKSGRNVFMGSSVDVDATLRFVLNNIHLQRPTYCYNYTLYNRPLDLNDWHEQRVSQVQKTVKDFENRQLGSIQMQREFINLKKQNVQQRRQFARYLMTSSKIEEVTIFIFKPKYL